MSEGEDGVQYYATLRLPMGEALEDLPLSLPTELNIDGRDKPLLTFEAFQKWFQAAIYQRMSKGFDAIIVIDGPRGGGKSTVAHHIKKLLGFDNSIFCFTMEEFIKKHKELPYSTADDMHCLVYDEAGLGFYRKTWWEDIQITANKWLQICRIKQTITILNLPHAVKLLNAETFNIMVWMRIWVTEDHIMEVSVSRPHKWESSWLMPLCAARFPRYEGKQWDDYEKAKMNFVDNASLGKRTETETNDKQRAAGLARYLLEKKILSAQVIADIWNVKRSTAYNYINLVEKDNKKDDVIINDGGEKTFALTNTEN